MNCGECPLWPWRVKASIGVLMPCDLYRRVHTAQSGCIRGATRLRARALQHPEPIAEAMEEAADIREREGARV